MSLSVPQKRLVQLMNNGAQLRIVRSVLNLTPVYCELLPVDPTGLVEIIPMWRIQKLLATGCVRLDTGDISTAKDIVPSNRSASSQCDDSDFEGED